MRPPYCHKGLHEIQGDYKQRPLFALALYASGGCLVFRLLARPAMGVGCMRNTFLNWPLAETCVIRIGCSKNASPSDVNELLCSAYRGITRVNFKLETCNG